MKIVRFDLALNLPDEFRPGACSLCPLSVNMDYDDAMRNYHRKIGCKLGFTKYTCPAKGEAEL